jgi:hypothetical protein
LALPAFGAVKLRAFGGTVVDFSEAIDHRLYRPCLGKNGKLSLNKALAILQVHMHLNYSPQWTLSYTLLMTDGERGATYPRTTHSFAFLLLAGCSG